MKNLRSCILVTVLLAGSTFAFAAKAPLTADQKTFLDHYGAIQMALAADNLGAAKQAAALVAPAAPSTDAAKKIAAADSLDSAREAFKALSKTAVEIAAGQPGYFHAHCPMVVNQEGDWIQTTKKISNPYFGKAMLTCGSIEG